jgi:hypothetical protein
MHINKHAEFCGLSMLSMRVCVRPLRTSAHKNTENAKTILKNLMWKNFTKYCTVTSIVLYFELLSNSLREYPLFCPLEPWHP